MSSKKRQQTMAKLRREQAVKERRALKQEKKEAARSAKAAGETLFGLPIEGLAEDPELGDDLDSDETADVAASNGA